MESSKVSRSLPQLWRRTLVRAVLLYGFIPYLAVTVLFATFQRRLMYRPTVASSLKVLDVGLDTGFGRDVRLYTADGCTLNGWLIQKTPVASESTHAPLLIYFPGNSANRFERLGDLREVAATGFDILIFDYRGYGDSTGRPNASTLSADARLVWDFACSRLNYDPRRIVIFGESLGGGVALSLWSNESPVAPAPAAIILNSTFTSMADVVAWHYPLFPFQYLLLDRWPSAERISRVTSPIVVFHGTADKMIPVAQGRELARRSPNSRFIEVSGASHNDIPMAELRREFHRLCAALTEEQ
ncbi:alpha/beta hydrolase [Schlesneria paludicola]|uniref:alpha/beta hydrolase n=1 Tax=Schlesneria paludicola TaxID=360056 RepID=UPI00029ABBAC|nr:alpha/beta hydrolase [Schlesneria paludicola]